MQKETSIISWPQSGRTWLITLISHAITEYTGEYDLASKFSDYFGKDLDLEKLSKNKSLHLFPREHEDQSWTKTSEELSTNKEYLNDMYKKDRKLPSNIFDIIFLVRNPKDALVSNYLRRIKIKNPNTNFNGTISEFIRSEKGSLKSMIKWLNIWAKEYYKMRNFCLVRYEDLHSDGIDELRRIIDFLGYKDIPNKILANAVEFANIEKMKKLEQTEGGKNHIMFSKDKNFVREGKVGKGKQYFNEKDNKYIDNMVKELDNMYRY